VQYEAVSCSKLGVIQHTGYLWAINLPFKAQVAESSILNVSSWRKRTLSALKYRMTELPDSAAISTGRRNTLTKTQKMACMLVNQRRHRGFTTAEKAELWDRWKRAGALNSIGRAFGEPSSSVYHQLTPHRGIEIPAERINAGVASTG
jgi:hypothetical protein